MAMPPQPGWLGALELKVPPPLVALLLGALMAWLALHSQAQAWPSALRMGAALVLALAGGCLDLAGLLAFRHQRTSVNPLRPDKTSALVTGGVYRITRNPMYLGMALILLAWAVWLGALGGFLGPLAFVAWITRFQIQPEERVLAERFGQAFTDYSQQVRRWL